MNDAERAIKDLEYFMQQHSHPKSFETALEALRAQAARENPQPVVWRYEVVWYCPADCGTSEGDEYGYVPYCPLCNKELDACKNEKFCPECGVKLVFDHEPKEGER